MELPRRQFAVAGLVAALAGCYGRRPATTARTTADTVVTTRRGLEAAFDDLAPGGSIWISAKNAPYRTSRWLDIDVDGVSIAGPGLPTLIEPADGANVGGIRIGHNDACRNVRVQGIGYHGNQKSQDDSAKKLHGLIVRDASNVTLTGNTIAHTHPFHEHGTGGSGISAEQASDNVRVLNNRIHHFGDRGIQLSGQNIVVSGNVVTDGIDRAISCDVWGLDGDDQVANTVIVSENVLGNCREGSLTGVASGPKGVGAGSSHVVLSNNIGFHKNFCHVRGPTDITNVSLRGNVSTQTTEGLWTNETTEFSGVTVDPAGGTGITITGNELTGYSRHGINVSSDVSDVKIASNTILDADRVGIRVRDATDGTIIDNTIARTGDHGVLLKDTRSITVTNNHLRDLALSGVALHSQGETHHTIGANHIDQPNENAEEAVASIHVDSSAVIVRGNTITQAASVPAISDSKSARLNVYLNNRTSDGTWWAISSPSSVVRNNVPSFDVHPAETASGSNDRVRISFEKPYDHRPKLSFARRGGGIRGIEYVEEDGSFVGAIVEVESPDEAVDVSVDAFE